MVVNSRYNPFTYDELIKPFNVYQEAYNEQTAALSKLETDANTLESALSQTDDPIAYQTYSNYLTKLRGIADEIATNGLHPGSKSEVLKLAGDYSKQIIPIQNAYNRRKELQDEQRKALLSNPTLYFQRNFNTPSGDEASIDKFVADPNYSYGNFFSGALLEKQVSDAASNLSKALQGYGVGKRLDAYTKTFLQQHGYSPEQVLDAINNPNRATSQPVLNSIVESVIQSSGVPTWGDEMALSTAYAHARRGLFSAVGQTSVSPLEDFGARHAATSSDSGVDLSGIGVPLNASNIHTQRELTEARKNYMSYNQYFEEGPDGTIKLTDAGKAEYERDASPKVNVSGSFGTSALMNAETKYNIQNGEFTKTPFRKFMDSIQQSEESAEDAWTRYLKENDDAKFDARYATEYNYNYNPSQQTAVKDLMLGANKGRDFEIVEFDRKTNSWLPTKETISSKDFAEKDYRVLGSKFSYGDSQAMVLKDGQVYRVRMPREIYGAAELNRDKEEATARLALKVYNALLEKGIYKDEKGNVIAPQTEEELLRELTKYKTIYNGAITNAVLYHSQIGLQNDTEDQKYSPYVLP